MAGFLVMETHSDLYNAGTETLRIMCTYPITVDSNLVPRFYFFHAIKCAMC